MKPRRAVSGMRPTGGLHLGHLRGVLSNWLDLQRAGDACFFFVADWHALTTDYARRSDLAGQSAEVASAWLAAGIDPERAVMFRQSALPAHAELFALLAMICPLPWLARLPTYKEQKENLRRDLDTYGFLGYPLLQSADILLYDADAVPVGEDQLPHIEFAREVARRFNRFYGGGEEFANNRARVAAVIGEENDSFLNQQKKMHAEKGGEEILQKARERIDSLQVKEGDRKILLDDLRYGGEEILREPQPLLTPAPRLPGTDGRKMSKSYDNAVELFDSPKTVAEKIAAMQTDPARVRKSDKGNPDNCPAYRLHSIFSDEETQQWAAEGCRGALIGCVECKKRLAKNINDELEPIRERREKFPPKRAAEVLAEGAKRARACAETTMERARRAAGL